MLPDFRHFEFKNSNSNCQLPNYFQMVLEYSKLASAIPLTRPIAIKDLQQLVAVFEYDDFEVGDHRFVGYDGD